LQKPKPGENQHGIGEDGALKLLLVFVMATAWSLEHVMVETAPTRPNYALSMAKAISLFPSIASPLSHP
jgi:hypothetical protein